MTTNFSPLNRHLSALPPTYRQLDRSKDEFRLLKILPPQNSSEDLPQVPDPLTFSQSPICCEIQYDSLETITRYKYGRDRAMNSILAYLLQDVSSANADNGRDTGHVVDLASGALERFMSIDKETKHQLGPERRQALQQLYEESRETMKRWTPEGIDVRSPKFEDWLASWIWTPLSGNENHLEQQSRGYFALSYVWRDERRFTLGTKNLAIADMIRASGTTYRQALEATDLTPDMIDGLCGEMNDPELEEIIVDGKPALLGKNIVNALRALREIPEIQRGTRVWVDALCINQNDVSEKNFEVKRMGQIYKNADRVISYIGEEKDHSGHILEFMEAIGEVIQRVENIAPLAYDFFTNLQVDLAIAMARLFLRSYFSRIWIVQEIVMGGHKSIAMCGARRFSWPNLLRCGKMLNAGFASATWNYDLPLDRSENAEEECLTLRDLKEGITKLQTLRDAHTNCLRQDRDTDQGVEASNTLWFRIPSSNNATDTRDLIYGMLSLLPTKLSANIPVDYSPETGFVDVMRAFAEAHITNTETLDWILHRHYQAFMNWNLWPTWVPNLAEQYSSCHWMWPLAESFHACPDVPCDASFAQHWKTRRHLVVCRGLKVDTIKQASRNNIEENYHRSKELVRMLEASLTQENFNELYPLIESCQQIILKYNATMLPDEELSVVELPYQETAHIYGGLDELKAAILECFERCNIRPPPGSNLFDVPCDAAEETGELSRGLSQANTFGPMVVAPSLSLFTAVRDVFAEIDLWGTNIKDLFPPRVADVEPGSFSAPIIEDRTAMFARLFTTCGGYLGACIGKVQTGDEVFLLPGCRMPVALRESTDVPGAYKLQGGIHIPGMMNGEPLNEGMEGRSPDFATIWIC